MIKKLFELGKNVFLFSITLLVPFLIINFIGIFKSRPIPEVTVAAQFDTNADIIRNDENTVGLFEDKSNSEEWNLLQKVLTISASFILMYTILSFIKFKFDKIKKKHEKRKK